MTFRELVDFVYPHIHPMPKAMQQHEEEYRLKHRDFLTKASPEDLVNGYQELLKAAQGRMERATQKLKFYLCLSFAGCGLVALFSILLVFCHLLVSPLCFSILTLVMLYCILQASIALHHSFDGMNNTSYLAHDIFDIVQAPTQGGAETEQNIYLSYVDAVNKKLDYAYVASRALQNCACVGFAAIVVVIAFCVV